MKWSEPIRRSDSLALTKGIFEGLLWGRTPSQFTETSQRQAVANLFVDGNKSPSTPIAVKNTETLTPLRKFFCQACDIARRRRSFRFMRMDSCRVPERGVGFHVAREAGLLRRSGPDGSRRPECVPYCPNPLSCVNVTLYKHVYYRNVYRCR